MGTGERLQLKKRLPIYILGLFVMALGVVLIAKASLGVSPLSAIPFAASAVSGLSFGTMTTAFHILCVLLQLVLIRRLTLKLLLQLPLATAFGLVVDLFSTLLQFGVMPVWLRVLVNLLGTLLSALGIVMIVGMDLMLPPPDALLRACSVQWSRPLSTVKMTGDIVFVAIAAAIELLGRGRITAVGAGTLISMICTGKFVGLLHRKLPVFDWGPLAAQDAKKPGEPPKDGAIQPGKTGGGAA